MTALMNPFDLLARMPREAAFAEPLCRHLEHPVVGEFEAKLRAAGRR
jgi:hypothetical protein